MVNSSLYNRFFDKKSFIGGRANNPKNTLFHLLIQKRYFLIMTFANLILQLGITYAIFYRMNSDSDSESDSKYKTQKSYTNFWIGAISLFIILFAMLLIPSPGWIKFLLFCLFSGIEGYLLSFIHDTKAINVALLGSLSIFGLMVGFSFALIAFGVYLSNKFGLLLFLLLLLLIIVRIIMILLPTSSLVYQGVAALGLILFSVYVIYDTNIILRNNYYGDYITASMDFYLDFINIFLNILNLN